MSRQPTFQLLGDADYTMLKPLKVSGVALDRGDLLPTDSPLRQNPRRLESLCRNRYMRPGLPETTAPAKAAAVSVPKVVVEEVKQKATSDDLDQMSIAQLRDRCRELGINASGGYTPLRERIRFKLAQ